MEASSSFVQRLGCSNRAGWPGLEMWVLVAGAARQSYSSLIVSGILTLR